MKENNISGTTDLHDQKVDEKLKRVKHIILVMSGKGGVGKSTVAVNLAVSLTQKGFTAGIMDIDLHGPDTLMMLGLEGRKNTTEENGIEPLLFGPLKLKVISIASFIDRAETALIWRGPLKIGVIKQFVTDVEWGDLDYLIIDSPPGTGDEPLTVAQTFRGASAIIVTTPQKVSLLDVRKSITFCRQLNMPIIGVIENMRGLSCPHCGEEIEIFSGTDVEETVQRLNLSHLGTIPIQPGIARAGDQGIPFVMGSAENEKDIRARFLMITEQVISYCTGLSDLIT